MSSGRRLIALAGVGLCAATAIGVSPAQAAPGGATTIAVIGDTPYGATAQNPASLVFPNLIGSINADPDVSLAMHLGDIKNGSTQCTNAYFNLVRDWVNGAPGFGPGFSDPLVFTPGDNEWTDCHRVNNGAFVPTTNGGVTPGRLETLRSTFFPVPGQTLGNGAPRTVDTQATVPGFATYVENTKWVDSNVVFGVVHVVGSNNGAATWFVQAGQTPETAQQTLDRTNELAGRKAAALAWIDAIFDDAVSNDRAGVLLGMQADTWDDPSLFPPVAPGNGIDQLHDIVAKIAQRSLAFGKPVLLMQGDSHVYTVDNPLDGTSALAALHPYNPTADPTTYPAVPNLTRIVVPGSNGASPNGLDSWIKVVVDPSTPQVFTTTLMPATLPPAVAIPEAPLTALLPLSAVALSGAAYLVLRRRSAASPITV
jgi:hypothetical protein